MEEPKRIYSNFIHGITEMKVRIPGMIQPLPAEVLPAGIRAGSPTG